MKIKFVALHAPLFHAGKNFTDKIYSHQLEMIFHEKMGKLLVKHQGIVGIVPQSSIGNMVPEEQEDLLKFFPAKLALSTAPHVHTHHPMVADIGKAQVEDPTTRVQNPRNDIKR